MTDREDTGLELLLSEPDIVAWLEADDHGEDELDPEAGTAGD